MIIYDYSRVPAIREARSCSIFEAKAIVKKEQLLQALNHARSDNDVGLLIDVVENILHEMRING